MSVLNRACALIRFHEGTEYKAYKDTCKELSADGTPGLWTWGVGWCLERYFPTQDERCVIRDITKCESVPFDKPLEMVKWLDGLPYVMAAKVSGFMLRSHMLGLLPRIETEINFWPDLDDNRAAALVDMAYNMGLGTLLTFRNTLGFMAGHRWIEAAHAILDSQYAIDVGKRAHRIAQMIASGSWPTDIGEPND
jgi:GH24 family phage-related lysozyme (muramidase)